MSRNDVEVVIFPALHCSETKQRGSSEGRCALSKGTLHGEKIMMVTMYLCTRSFWTKIGSELQDEAGCWVTSNKLMEDPPANSHTSYSSIDFPSCCSVFD